MKKLLFLALLLIGLGSCQKEEISPLKDESSSIVTPPDSLVPPGGPKGTLTESAVSPKFGKPNSTYYYFKVYDPSGSLALSVKLTEKATGTITYLPMTKVGSYWTLSKKISINGWYDYRYVYSGTKANISSNTYMLCNTNNMFNSCPYAITWPFGADGSSWYNRKTWNGGQEGGSGSGWGEGFHTGTSEYYSDDWNRDNDLGAEIRSPLDGYVEICGSYLTSLGTYSKYVAIRQEYNGKIYRFYVGHLQSYPSGLTGKYVRAGVTKIGNLGNSGADNPHAHTNLRDVTNGAITSVSFYFNAQGGRILLLSLIYLHIGEVFLPYVFYYVNN